MSPKTVPSNRERPGPFRPKPIAIGTLTHRLVAHGASQADRPSPGPATTDWILGSVVDLLVAAGGTSRRQAALQKSASLASVYWRQFAPESHWRLISAELAYGDDRVDLAWETGDGVLVDEIKTSVDALGPGDEATALQGRRYAAAGRKAHGARFLGVRVLTLALPRRAIFVSPAGSISALALNQIGGVA